MLKEINKGQIQVVYKDNDDWHVNESAKQALLAMFQKEAFFIKDQSYDKIPLKFTHWKEEDFKKECIRIVPGAIVRYSAYIGCNAVIMPSFVNIGVYIDEGTLIDSMVTVGSCAYIGKRCHISSGVTIGGVLEPIQARPVIIEDNCFIGAGCIITEGMIIGHNSVLASGVILSSGTKIVERQTQQIIHGTIPPHSVVVPGQYKIDDHLSVSCAVIVKQKDEKTNAKTALNDLLR